MHDFRLFSSGYAIFVVDPGGGGGGGTFVKSKKNNFGYLKNGFFARKFGEKSFSASLKIENDLASRLCTIGLYFGFRFCEGSQE